MSVETVLGELVKRSMGELERAVLATLDGVTIAASNPSDIDDIVAALGAAVVAGVGEAFRQYFSTGVRDVVVELEDGRIVMLRELKNGVICLVSKSNPNLGLIYYLLDKYTKQIEDSVKSAS
ncbi:MAG: roadblock/LC7 domain-containing protein [Thermofilaceae archaeon]